MTQRLMTQDGDNVILLAEMSCEAPCGIRLRTAGPRLSF